MDTWFDFRTWKTVIGRSTKIWFPYLKCGQFVLILSEICWISKIFRTCQASTHFKGNFMLIKNCIRNLCSKPKVKKLYPTFLTHIFMQNHSSFFTLQQNNKKLISKDYKLCSCFFLITCVTVLGTMDWFPTRINLYFKNKKSNVLSLHFELFEYIFYFNIFI